MTVGPCVRHLILAAVIAALSHSPASAEQKIALCHAGLIKLGSFDDHIKAIREARRYEPEDIDGLIKKHDKYGAEFFSSQIIVQEELSGSGTFDLRMCHGLSHAADYRNVTAWDCQRADIRSSISSASGCARSKTIRSSCRARRTSSTLSRCARSIPS